MLYIIIAQVYQNASTTQFLHITIHKGIHHSSRCDIVQLIHINVY
nr:MAG TPA: hypothetical protein [Caudoviricetes sp.]